MKQYLNLLPPRIAQYVGVIHPLRIGQYVGGDSPPRIEQYVGGKTILTSKSIDKGLKPFSCFSAYLFIPS